MGVPEGNEVPLSGLTVTSMSESVHAVPLADVEGLGDAEVPEAEADAPSGGDELAPPDDGANTAVDQKRIW